MQHSCGYRFCNDTIFQIVMPTICVIRGLNYKNRMEFTNFSHKFNIIPLQKRFPASSAVRILRLIQQNPCRSRS